MRVVALSGHTFDLDQISSTRLEAAEVVITFRNADQIHLRWRDTSERRQILTALESPEVDPPQFSKAN